MHSIRTGENFLRISRKLGNIASDIHLHREIILDNIRKQPY